MITIGIVMCTIVSGQEIKSTQKMAQDGVPPSQMENLFWWSLGITLLTVALFISARMGLYQETLYVRYGKHPKEALYYTVSIKNNVFQHFL